MPLLRVVLLLAFTSCYSLDVAPCKITCAGNDQCPKGYACRSGYCQEGTTDRCGPGQDGGVEAAPTADTVSGSG